MCDMVLLLTSESSALTSAGAISGMSLPGKGEY